MDSKYQTLIIDSVQPVRNLQIALKPAMGVRERDPLSPIASQNLLESDCLTLNSDLSTYQPNELGRTC